jgi:hypothetical protein
MTRRQTTVNYIQYSVLNVSGAVPVQAHDIKPLADMVGPCVMHSHMALMNPRRELHMHNTLLGYNGAHRCNLRQLYDTKCFTLLTADVNCREVTSFVSHVT